LLKFSLRDPDFLYPFFWAFHFFFPEIVDCEVLEVSFFSTPPSLWASAPPQISGKGKEFFLSRTAPHPGTLDWWWPASFF